jgi:hypothetical protein
MNFGRRAQRRHDRTQIRRTMGRTSPEFLWADQRHSRTRRRQMRRPTPPRQPRRSRRVPLPLRSLHLRRRVPKLLRPSPRAPRPSWIRNPTGWWGQRAGRGSHLRTAGMRLEMLSVHTRATTPCPAPSFGIGRGDRSEEQTVSLHPRKGRSDRLMRVTIASHARFSGCG